MDITKDTAVERTRGGEISVSYRGRTFLLVPSERKNKGERTYDVRDADHPERVYTYLLRGSKGGFSGNRIARLKGTAERGWLSYGNHLHPQDTPEAAALHYLKWSYRRSRRGRKTNTFRRAAS